jgi:hypothetical protein
MNSILLATDFVAALFIVVIINITTTCRQEKTDVVEKD